MSAGTKQAEELVKGGQGVVTPKAVAWAGLGSWGKEDCRAVSETKSGTWMRPVSHSLVSRLFSDSGSCTIWNRLPSILGQGGVASAIYSSVVHHNECVRLCVCVCVCADTETGRRNKMLAFCSEGITGISCITSMLEKLCPSSRGTPGPCSQLRPRVTSEQPPVEGQAL